MKTQRYCGMVPLVFALAALLAFAGTARNAAAQDLTIHSTTTSPGMMGRGGGSVATTEYFTKNAIKTSTPDGVDTIIRLDSGKLITVDNRKKTYSETTFQQLQEQLNKAGAEMQGMSKEDMEAMKKVMGTMASSITVTKAGPGETIAGYATDKYLLQGFIEGEICASSTLKVPATYYDVMKLQVPSMPMLDLGKMYDEMKKINGIPLKTVTVIRMMGTEMKTTKVVTAIEKGAIPASVFEIPAGYKLVQR